ncbi:MAG: ATP-binding protein [Nannocystaceae bacterium]|nr:ATP-binding protein [bacterium]
MRTGFLEALSRVGVGQESLDHTLDHAPFGVLIDHPEEGCIYASDEVLRIFEMEWEQLRGFGWMAAVLPEDTESLRGTFERYQRDKKPIEVRYRIKTPGGDVHHITSFANPILDASGKQLGSLIVGRRAPERRLTERTLETQKLEAIGRLAAQVSHDFNNILTPILCSAALLDSDSLSPDDRELVATIQQGTEHAAALTQQLLGLSKRTGHGPKSCVIDLEIRELRPMIDKLIGERLELTLDLGAADARVVLAPHEIGQVLLNLCVNARDAVAGVGKLAIRTSLDGDLVTVTVHDNGRGIPLDVQQRMFEPFFTTKSPDRGTGLGLSSTRDLLRRAGGDIAVRSELGRGTQMQITLPLASMAPPAACAPSGQVAPSVDPQRILLVDDNDPLRQTLAYVLAMRGHTVETSATVERAKALLQEQAFDVLVSDILLPDGRGEELISAAPDDLRVLFISGYPGEEIGPDRTNDPRFGFLPKPFRPEALLVALASLVNARQADAG